MVQGNDDKGLNRVQILIAVIKLGWVESCLRRKPTEEVQRLEWEKVCPKRLQLMVLSFESSVSTSLFDACLTY